MMLELDGVTHAYGSDPAVEDVSFGLDGGELVALLGPSGCGKTTIVQAIAGHIRPDAGRIRLRGTDVTDSPPEERGVGVVFQQSTLYPHMTVGENVAYGLEARGIDPERRARIVADYLELVELADQRESYPGELSGGQRRRGELARALAPEPDVLILDEPLSSLDRSLSDQLRVEIDRIQRETGVTTLYVTHDQEEAMSLADRLVILHQGSVSATGEPRHLYESPPNRFVASFLGRSDTLAAPVLKEDPLTLRIGETPVEVNGRLEHSTLRLDPDTEPVVHVRPDDVVVTSTGTTGADIELPGAVRSVKDVGSRYDVHIRLASGAEITATRRGAPPAVDDHVVVGVDRRDLTLFPQQEGE
jgi:ABC-type Fe3+/spermidine/putrescine transport system ATPase subunit